MKEYETFFNWQPLILKFYSFFRCSVSKHKVILKTEIYVFSLRLYEVIKFNLTLTYRVTNTHQAAYHHFLVLQKIFLIATKTCSFFFNATNKIKLRAKFVLFLFIPKLLQELKYCLASLYIMRIFLRQCAVITIHM